MILITGGIPKKSMTLRTFRRGPVRGTGGVGQTKRATMRTGGSVFLDVIISFVTIIAVIFVFGHSGRGKYGIVMLVGV